MYTKFHKLKSVIGKDVIESMQDIEKVDTVLYKYISYLDNVYAKNPEIDMEEIHRTLPYYNVKSEMFIKYYKLEYLSALIKMSLQKGIEIDKEPIKYIEDQFEKIELLLYECIKGSAKVWLIRELYYLEQNINIKNRHSKEEVHDFLCNLYKGTKKRFPGTLYDDTVNYENKTDIFLYIRTRYSLRKIILSDMPLRAKINLLVNLSHNNGILADKMIRDSSAEKLLSDLSKGYFTKEVEREFFLLTKVRYDFVCNRVEN